MFRDEKYTQISKKMKFEKPASNSGYVPVEDQIHHIEIFQSNYGGNPLSRFKIDRNIKRIKN